MYCWVFYVASELLRLLGGNMHGWVFYVVICVVLCVRWQCVVLGLSVCNVCF